MSIAQEEATLHTLNAGATGRREPAQRKYVKYNYVEEDEDDDEEEDSAFKTTNLITGPTRAKRS